MLHFFSDTAHNLKWIRFVDTLKFNKLALVNGVRETSLKKSVIESPPGSWLTTDIEMASKTSVCDLYQRQNGHFSMCKTAIYVILWKVKCSQRLIYCSFENLFSITLIFTCYIYKLVSGICSYNSPDLNG